MKKLLLIFCSFFVFQLAMAQKNTVYIVRHAEKDLTDTDSRNPELSFEGKQRALNLRRELRGKDIDVVFSTDYTRTRNTAGPLKDYRGISLVIYNAAKLGDLVDLVKKDYEGKNVLIVGHSNTILETVAAFGGEKPFDSVSEDIYDNLFRVTINGDKVAVSASKYGKKSEIKN